MSTFRRRLMMGAASAIKEGVFIQDTTNYLWNVDEWDGSATAATIVVLDRACDPFGIVPTFDSARVYGAKNGYTGPYRDTFRSESNAKLDYKGYDNTQSTIDYATNTASSAAQLNTSSAMYKSWNSYSVTVNGKKLKTYLASLGQLILIYKYKADINAALKKIEKSSIPEAELWSSTSYGINYGASASWADTWNLNMSTNEVVYEDLYQVWSSLKFKYIVLAQVSL